MSQPDLIFIAHELQRLSNGLVSAIGYYDALATGAGMENLSASLQVEGAGEGTLLFDLPHSVLLQVLSEDPTIREQLDAHVLQTADALVSQLQTLQELVSFLRQAAELPQPQEA